MQITKSGLEKLNQELSDAKVLRKEISKRIQAAKELGDLSENAEYSEAKEAQLMNESRIAELTEQIRQAQIVEAGSIKGIVQIGSLIKVKSNNSEQVFKIVGANESDPSRGWISNQSPLGAAFLGKRKSDEIEVQLPSKKVCYKILEILE